MDLYIENNIHPDLDFLFGGVENINIALYVLKYGFGNIKSTTIHIKLRSIVK